MAHSAGRGLPQLPMPPLEVYAAAEHDLFCVRLGCGGDIHGAGRRLKSWVVSLETPLRLRAVLAVVMVSG